MLTQKKFQDEILVEEYVIGGFFHYYIITNIIIKRASITYLSIPGVPSAMIPETSTDIVICFLGSIFLLIFCSLMKPKY